MPLKIRVFILQTLQNLAIQKAKTAESSSLKAVSRLFPKTKSRILKSVRVSQVSSTIQLKSLEKTTQKSITQKRAVKDPIKTPKIISVEIKDIDMEDTTVQVTTVQTTTEAPKVTTNEDTRVATTITLRTVQREMAISTRIIRSKISFTPTRLQESELVKRTKSYNAGDQVIPV